MGDNPHIWYDPKTMLAVAELLRRATGAADPHINPTSRNNSPLLNTIIRTAGEKNSATAATISGTAVIATEPVFNDMADALGLVMQGQGFQLSIMNDTEPAVSDVKDFENKLTNIRLKYSFLITR